MGGGVRSGRGACRALPLPPDRVRAYLELHIEQGPVLDTAEIPVGIVTGIPGSRRLRNGNVLGEWNHSGATLRAFRHDAAIALAEFAYRLDDAWAELEAKGHRLVVTFCVLATPPRAGMGMIAGEAGFSLDVPSVDSASVDLLWDKLIRIADAVAARRGVRFRLRN